MNKEETILGKRILVGLTYLDREGKVREQLQLYGPVNAVSETTLRFERSDGEGEFSIPFDGELEVSDEEDIYTLKSTGEEVTGVCYIASFTIHPPDDENS